MDECDAASECAPWKRVDDDGGWRAHAHRRRILFEDRDVHPQHAAVGDQKEIRPRLHRLTLDDVFLCDLARARSPQRECSRDGAARLQTVDLIRGNVPQREPAARARGQGVVPEPPRKEILLLRAHEIGRVKREQGLPRGDALADVIGVQLLHPAVDAGVDIGLARFGVFEDAHGAHGGSDGLLGCSCEPDAESCRLAAIDRHAARIGCLRRARHARHVGR